MAKQKNAPPSAPVSDSDVQTASATEKALKSQADVNLDDSLSPGSAQADLGASAANAAAMSLFYAFDRDDSAPLEQAPIDHAIIKDNGSLPTDAKSEPMAMPETTTNATTLAAGSRSDIQRPMVDVESLSKPAAAKDSTTAQDATFSMGSGVVEARTIALEDGDVLVEASGPTNNVASEEAASSQPLDNGFSPEIQQPPANLASVSSITDSDGTSDGVVENAAVGTSVGITAFAQDADGSDSVSYSLSDDAGGLFAIDGVSGEVTVAGSIDREVTSDYTIEVTATSSDGSTSTQSYTISIDDQDEFDVTAVSDTNAAADTLSEDAGAGTTVGVVASASDGDATDSVSYSVDDARFTVDADGTVRVASGASFDRESEASIDITVTATSTDGSTSQETFTLSVSDVNDTAQVFTSATSTTAAENVSDSAVVYTAATTDADTTGEAITYTLTDDAGGLFEIDANTGEVSLAAGQSLDYESATDHTITIQSSDGTNTTDHTVTVNVGDVNDNAQQFTSGTSTTAAENVADTAVLYTATTTDVDTTGEAITYTLSDDAGGLFEIDANTGEVSLAAGQSLDYESATDHTITIQSSDGTNTTDQTVTINVSDVNESGVSAISDSDGTSDGVVENAAVGTSVGITAFAQDADGSDSVSYSLSDDAGGLFAIDGVSGEVTVAGSIDREVASDYTIEVTATSSDGSTSTQSYTISIDDQDEFDVTAVSDTNAAADTLSEDAGAGTTVGVVASASDGDATDSVSYSVDDARFTVDADGTVRVASGASFDRESEASIDITVTATSTDGSTSQETFTLSVSDVNDTAQVFTSATSTTAAENVSDSAVVYTAATTDADTTGEAITYTLTDDAGGLFEIDANTGEVSLAAGQSLDYESATDHTITIQSSDGTNTTDHTVTVNVGDVNDNAQQFTSGTSTTAAENVADTAVLYTATTTDVDTTGEAITYTLSDDAGGLFEIDANTGEVSLAAGQSLDYESATDHTITIQSSDGTNTTDQTVTINVSDVNESGVSAISDSDGTSDGVVENAAVGTSVGITAFAQDADGSDSVSYSLSDDAGGLFAIDGVSGEVTVAGSIDREVASDYTIEVTATSSDGSTSTQSYTISIDDQDEFDVTAVSDTNAAADTLSEDAGAGTTVGVVASASDGDATDSVSYSVDDARFTVDADGTVRVASGASFDRESEASIDITVTATSTDGSTSQETFTLSVSDVNDTAQVFTSATSTTAAENVSDSAVVYTAATTDADTTGEAITYTLTDDAGGLFEIDANTGEVSLAAGQSLDYESATDHTITIQSSDGTNTTDHTVTVNVGDVNDNAQQFTSGTSTTAAENVADTAVLYTATTTDVDTTGEAITYTLSDDAGGLFEIDANTGEVSLAAGQSLDYESATDHTITIQSSDGTNTTDQTVTINVSDVNESGVSAISDSDGTSDGVVENAAVGTSVGITAFAQDADGSDSVSYSLSDDAGGLFAIDGVSGEVTVAGSIDREVASDYTIEVTATSSDGSTSTQSYTISIDDQDEFDVTAVSDTNAAADTLSEDAGAGTTVGVVASASDGDATDSVSYSVDDARFTVDADGTVRVASGASFDRESEASIDITVTATSTDGSTSQETFTLSVSDVNDTAQVFTSATSTTAAENVSDSAVVYTAATTDADTTGEAITYTLTDDAGGLFEIDANTGEVSLAAGQSLDYESATDHTITIQSSDGTNTTDHTVTVNVGDVNDNAQQFTSGTSTTAAENVADTAVLYTATTTDVDTTGEAITYTLSDDAGGLFEIDANTGEVSLAAGQSLDYESATDHTITIQSSDGTNTTDQTVTINVSDVNESGVSAISDSDGTSDGVVENAAVGTSVGITAFAQDADGSDSVSYSLSDDAGGLFAIDGVSGEVTVAGSIDREVASDYTIEVTATSSDGSTSTQSYTISIDDQDEFDVTAVSDTNAAADTLSEDAGAGTTVGVVASASDGDATDSVSYSVDDARFTVDADGTVRVASGASFDRESEASIDITVTATSTDGSTSQETFTLSVSDVNDTAQVFTSATSTTAAENVSDSAVVYTAATTDADTTGEAITYTLTDDAGGLFEIDANTGEVSLAAGQSLDYESATDHTITIQSSDGTNTTDHTVTVNVGDVNDNAQQFTSGTSTTAAENVADTAVLYTATTTDVDTTGEAITYTLSDDAGGLFEIDANTGEVSLAAGQSLDYESATDHTITIQSSDGTNTTDQTVTINVSDVNESGVSAISDSDGTSDGVVENAAVGTSVGITAFAQDADGSDSVSYSLSDDAGGLFAIDGVSGEVTVAGSIDREVASDYTIEVTATSSDGSTSTQSYTISIDDQDEFDVTAVSDTNAAADTLSEDAGAGTTVGVVASASDGDATDSVSYSVDDARFTVDADGTVRVASGASFDRESEASIDITVTATSTDGSTSQETFTLSVSDVNDTAQVFTSATSTTAAENVSDSAVVYTAATTDADTTGEAITYTLTDDAGGLFEIDANTGEVSLAAGQSLDYESATDHTITIQSSDGTNTTDHTVTVNVGDVNDNAQQFTSGTSTTAAENVADTAVLYTATTTDVDTTGEAITYTLSDDAGGLFEIDANTGEVSLAAGQSLDYESATDHTITIQSSDGTNTTDQTVTVNVGDVNDNAQQFTSGTSTTAAENVSDSAVVYTATTTDADTTGEAITYTLTDDAGGLFEIDANTGEVSLADGQSLDYESATDHTITIQSSDGTNTTDQTVTINVSDVNEAPTDMTFGGNENLSVTDGAAGGNAVVTGEIRSNGSSSVDHWSISHNGGDLVIDVLAGGYNGGSLDSDMILYRDNGDGTFTQVGANDDGATGSDGSTSGYDSYLSMSSLPAGDYVLAISSYRLTSSEALNTASDYPNGSAGVGPYQVSFTGDSVVNGIAENPNNPGNSWGDPLNDAVVVDSGAGIPGTIAAGSVVAEVTSVVDVDNGDTYSFTLTDNAGGKFAIDPNTGDISLVADHNVTTVYSDTVTVQVTDGGGNSYTETIGINLGTNGADIVTGTADNEILYGFDGADTLDGGAGDDVLIGDSSNETPHLLLNTDGGNDDYAIASNIADFPATTLSFEVRFAADSIPGDRATLVNYHTSGGDDFSVFLNTSPNEVSIEINGVFYNTGISSSSLTSGSEHMLSVTWDSATGALNVYVDGTASYSGTAAQGFSIPANGTLTFGQEQDSLGGSFQTTEVFSGTIDEVRLFNDIRTSQEISDNHATQLADPAQEQGLVSNWQFDSQDGSTVSDLAGSNDLTLSNGATVGWVDSNSNDTLQGGEGNDILIGGAGADVFDGGADFDTVDYSGAGEGVNVAFQNTDGNGAGGTMINVSAGGHSGQALGDSYTNIENFVGTSHDDNVFGGSTDMTFNLGDGNDVFDTDEDNAVDTIHAGAGNDTIWSGNADDLIYGEAGNDSIDAEVGNDRIDGGTGNDNLRGGDGNDLFVYAAGDGSDIVNGGAGGGWTDVIELQGMDGAVSISGNTVTGQGWTLEVDGDHTIDGQTGESLDLSDDASGTISFDDGSTMTFDNIEQLSW